MDESAEKVGLRNAWGRVADTYEDRWAQRTAHLTAMGLDALQAPEGGRGLDIGCGPGLTTAALGERLGTGEALGVDFAPAMVARASGAARASRSRWTTPSGSLSPMPRSTWSRAASASCTATTPRRPCARWRGWSVRAAVC